MEKVFTQQALRKEKKKCHLHIHADHELRFVS